MAHSSNSYFFPTSPGVAGKRLSQTTWNLTMAIERLVPESADRIAMFYR
ncbi:hypothetical protein BofuT4_uP075300.1 [Botrytis cinerea T4]|uniref:Uncharacterized protein n=1 Tax=Botryotinia fuckeliana (strain T4) TaxID=999810 RepID=G2XNJ1_BOTF4|nr:hypothetical protein BofuT4_uP075300.1 [Botrytis cinerea T4]